MAKTLIKTLTASTSSSLEFIDGASGVVFDNTYPVYEFHYVSMHPVSNQVDFEFQVNAAGASGFNETITSSFYYIQHGEGAASGWAEYDEHDQEQTTAYQALNYETGFDADQNCSGVLTVYNPSSTTFLTHFMAESNNSQGDDFCVSVRTAGYVNTTSAVDEIAFRFDSGAIQTGTIKMFGVT